MSGLDEGQEPLAHFVLCQKLKNVDVKRRFLRSPGTQGYAVVQMLSSAQYRGIYNKCLCGWRGNKRNPYTNIALLLPLGE